MAEQEKPLMPDELAAIRERVEAATPGPWEWEEWRAAINAPPDTRANSIVYCVMYEDDGPFIAASRTDIPRLLATVDADQQRITALQAERDAYRAIVERVADLDSTNFPGDWSGYVYEDVKPLVTQARALLGEE
jgi:hypothetical protein